jgi:hypothetical protein
MALLVRDRKEPIYNGLKVGTKVRIIDKAREDVDEAYRLKGKIGTLDSTDEDSIIPDLIVLRGNDQAVWLSDFIVEEYKPKKTKTEELAEFV